VFSELRIGDFSIQLNNRKLMRGFFKAWAWPKARRQLAVLREVDKLDKRGADYVRGRWWARASTSRQNRSRRSWRSSPCVRRAMPMRSQLATLKPTPVLRRSCVPASPNCAKCCSWCRRWACRKPRTA
jgi:hypothetical protein